MEDRQSSPPMLSAPAVLQHLAPVDTLIPSPAPAATETPTVKAELPSDPPLPLDHYTSQPPSDNLLLQTSFLDPSLLDDPTLQLGDNAPPSTIPPMNGASLIMSETELQTTGNVLLTSDASAIAEPGNLHTSLAGAPMDDMGATVLPGGIDEFGEIGGQLLPTEYDEAGAAISLPPATGFAKLEFDDGHFYMTTYAVELGRDMRAYKRAKIQAAKHQIGDEQRRGKNSAIRSSSVPGTPARPLKGDGSASVARSFVSESGGIVGDDDGHISLRRRRRQGEQRSADTSSQSLSRKNSLGLLPSLLDEDDAPQTINPNDTARLDPAAHVADPKFVPLIPIHPPRSADDQAPMGKGISRRHVKIAYNFRQNHFEMEVYGRNGAFHDLNYVQKDEVVPLHDGSVIEIGGVQLRFVLPNVAIDEVGDEHGADSVSGRMSFSFEDGQGESIVAEEESDAESYSSPPDMYALQLSYNVDEDQVRSDDENEEDESEDSSSDVEETPRVRIRLSHKQSLKKKSSKHSKHKIQGIRQKYAPTLKLNMNKKAKAKVRERQAAREHVPEKPSRIPAPKAPPKAAAKAPPKAPASKAVPKPAKEPKEPKEPKENHVSPKLTKDVVESTEAGELVKEEPKAKDAGPVRIARDEPLQNGEDINIPGLPAGMTIPPRRKGPGRPPKDGFMSKRERALLLKQAKEIEKAKKLGIDPSELPPPDMKPKPRPRKDSTGQEIEDEAREELGDDDDRKTPKIPKPPRSPSPQMKLSDYTEEQLQRPTPNYVYLIYEAIQNSKTGVMNLQQIYSAIERKYPYFKFRVTSNGWQSSVRHNLGQHEAFRKVEKDGKGWLWGIKEGVPIEKERKKKSPPPQLPPNQASAPPYPHYPYPQYPPQPGAPSPYGMPAQPYPQPPRPAPLSIPSSLVQQSAPRPQSYSSPYAVGAKKDPDPPRQHTSPYAMSNPTSASPYGIASHPPAPTHTASHSQSPYPTYRTPHPSAPPPQTHNHSPTPHPSTSTPKPKYSPPSDDVIDTFKTVFISTIKNQNRTIDHDAAARVVNNAIRRVLDPDAMANTPPEKEELAVASQFEKCLIQSQGPPRQTAPIGAPANSSNMSNGTASTSNPTPLLSPPIAAAAAAKPYPQRSAEANLISMLTGAPPSAPEGEHAAPTAPMRAPTAVMHSQQHHGYQVPPTQQGGYQSAYAAVNLTAPAPQASQATKPAIHALQLPQSLAAAAAQPAAAAQASKSPVPVPAIQIPPSLAAGVAVANANGAAAANSVKSSASGTATPTRPDFEPLTPPAGVVEGKKRVLDEGADDGRGKRAKVEG
ncbi:hypothetical protein EJ06DRAFT_531180 [Trichodelitschia bisporula]|uniref:Fork-head domain-containing protein n=1 Tax=Trichodelitschia bisporula TaxID=703511 RepID=A0A6G1HUW2_9PEZI|nr:hypothetical protein EJ06DRAFT_531180 [Trichodelitschia bisporula]